MTDDVARCELCGGPMPPGEQMFRFHGFSGPCPMPPLPHTRPAWIDTAANECSGLVILLDSSRLFAEIIERHYKSRAIVE